ncbi:MAG: PqqD family protein [Bacteroidales bacterium]|nr:PqqD family protein [Bacteroidales bacterium]
MKIVEGFRLREIMGQATVIGEGVNQVDFNKLITLNATAAYLWKEVEGKDFNQANLADLLVKKYGIDEELAQKDAAAVLDKWIEIGLVK